MHGATFDLVSQLLGAARYDEVERLVRALERDSSAVGGAAAESLASARELCRACRSEHTWTEAHWRAAAEGTVRETDLRLRLTMLLERAARGRPGWPDPVATAAGRTTVPPRSVVRDRRPRGSAPFADAGLVVECLGPLRVLVDDRDLGPLPNRRAKSVFKYLLLRRGRPTPKEVLMDLFWPDATPRAARNSLNVAVHGLRRFLRGRHDGAGADGVVVYSGDGYELAPTLLRWVDLDEFVARADAARACA